MLMGPGEDAGIVRFHTSQNGETYGIVLRTNRTIIPVRWFRLKALRRELVVFVEILHAWVHVLLVRSIVFVLRDNLSTYETIALWSDEWSGGYGNPLGVPNLGGDLLFDESFHENCLVNVVALGNSSRKWNSSFLCARKRCRRRI